MDERAHPHERELRALMMAGLDGDSGAYHTLLERLTGHLRAYYRHRLALIGHGPTEAEDLLQEVLIAVLRIGIPTIGWNLSHPGFIQSRATSFWTISGAPNLRSRTCREEL
jgi:hypothetical protein